MSDYNVNVIISGPNNEHPATYKTFILRGNTSFADQVTEPNTKYVIKWDFNLNGETVTVPENCILEFDGGTLKNGTIIGQDTFYSDEGGLGDDVIFGEGIIKEGTWRKNAGGNPDKPYDPTTHSGLGRKTLELKEGGSNVLTQQDFSDSNTIYIIQYDFDLNGAEIDVPTGSIVEFDGGSISNGTIICDGTTIDAGTAQVFDNVILQGTIIGDLILNNFKHSADCVTSRENLGCAIHVIGNCVIDTPMLVKSDFSIYGDDMYHTILSLDQNYSGSEAKSIFIFDSDNTNLIIRTSFMNFGAVNADYVFYREQGNKSNYGGSIMLADFKNLYFTDIKINVFYMHCAALGCANLVNLNFRTSTSGALMDFDCLWWNDNTIERCRCQGKNSGFLKVFAWDRSERGQITHNNIINNYIEKVTLNPGALYLFNLQCEYSIYDINIENNYIEGIKKDGGTYYASLFRIYDEARTRLVNFNANTIVGHYCDTKDGDVVIDEAAALIFYYVSNLNLSNNGTYGMNLAVKANPSMAIEACTYNNTCNFSYSAYRVDIENLNGINTLKDYVRTMNHKTLWNGYIEASEQEGDSHEIALRPDIGERTIYWSDVMITYGNAKLLHGKIMQMGQNFVTKFVILHQDDSDIEVVRKYPDYDVDGTVIITNKTNARMEIKVAVLCMTL